ncbi:alpha-N-acetyl-neuraminyl-2,3-beta-galactosyl-1,3-N-acetyl-galactosaminide alpha-2,6-sialyltransferase-like isoform X1 [Diadema antillarum]|uniref:alpha-N-acetyl-neuraminyl-2,3-beta-galactosyl-1, 3-N-acetyl-galactosaminide alpha-2,6-sialyltransferase-like isoform X1 n=1 Tax=Diadema antillarum TaxID=105358 RepID=UPI003A896F73
MHCDWKSTAVRDATLLIICWYSLIVSLCMLYVLHTHSNIVDAGSQLHEAQLRSDHASPQHFERQGWVRSAAFLNGNADAADTNLRPRPTTSTAGPDIIVTSNATSKPSSLQGYTLLDSDAALNLHCDRCSLVSSSGRLLNSGAGADIDNADCVLRMNSAPVGGYEEDVGARTDVRVIGHVNLHRGLMTNQELREEILANPITRTSIVVVPWLYQEHIDKSNNSVYSAARNMSGLYPDVKFYFLTPEKINKTEERFRIETGVSLQEAKTWLSTGFVAMLFALDVCDRIDVYGLANLDYCERHPNSTFPYHYYEPGIRRECDYYKWSETQMTRGHKFMTEKAVFARWSLGYNIHFHYPSWRATIKNVTSDLKTPFLKLYKEALKNGTLEQIRKAAPHVRVIRRVKVIRRRVKKPRPKVEEKKEAKVEAKSPNNEQPGPNSAQLKGDLSSAHKDQDLDTKAKQAHEPKTNVKSAGKADPKPHKRKIYVHKPPRT